MIRCHLMDMLYMVFSTVLIPLASDVMHEFHGIEWNFHILFYCSTIRVSEESQKFYPHSSKQRKITSTMRVLLFVMGSANLFVGQQKKTHTSTEKWR